MLEASIQRAFALPLLLQEQFPFSWGLKPSMRADTAVNVGQCKARWLELPFDRFRRLTQDWSFEQELIVST